MDTVWQVALGVAAATLIISLFSLYRDYEKQSKEHNESQALAKRSIFLVISGIILVFEGNALGIILGVISIFKNKYNALAKIGIALSILTALPWLAVIIFGK
ncbi:MAG: hypothetical protein DRI84_01500 [Bacteroidetes bacterium]|nr:MAG: hypothetical protein DRI84_01500 [Bacteroidota bacterium]